MAYAIKYQIQFLNIDGDNCRVDLLLKDYVGAITQLTGAADPFTLAYESGDDNIINPIRASECTINFYNEGTTPLTTFYSEDDEAWKIEFSVEPAIYPGSGHVLIWTGFLVQDDCREQFNDPPYQVQLKGTDNIGLLKDVPFNEAWFSESIGVRDNYSTYRQEAASSSDGIITLGITPLTTIGTDFDYSTGDSPYQDLAGFNLSLNDDRWIIKNGPVLINFRLQGTIDVTFTGFSENYRWIVQSNTGVIVDLVPNQLVTVGVHNVFSFDVPVTLASGQRLFAMGVSEGNFANDKTYGESTWTMTLPMGTRQTQIIDKMPLMSYIKFSILKTGLPLPLTTYINIYEDSEEDRSVNPMAEMLLQTPLFSGMFLNDDGTWRSCYEILEIIFFALNATFMQVVGWQIIRFPELKSGNPFCNRFEAGIYDVVESPGTYDQTFTIATGSGNYFINADATRGIVRPYKYSRYTFNYEQPKQLIYNNDLKITGPFHGTASGPDPNYAADFYEIPPFWTQINTNPGNILIAVSHDLTTSQEIGRSIAFYHDGNQYRWLRFNPIDVTKDGSIDFSFAFNHNAPLAATEAIHVRILLITPDGEFYSLLGRIDVDGSVPTYLQWSNITALPVPVDVGHLEQEVTNPGGPTSSVQNTFSLESFLEPHKLMPSIPADGCLLIDLGCPKDAISSGITEFFVYDIKLELNALVTRGAPLIGQKHTTNATVAKNVLEEDILIDDSPRNPIAGTLFTSALTDFAETIGAVHFTRTKSWHRYLQTESRRLGEITTLEREIMQDRVRAKIDCTIKHYFGPVTWLSPLALIRVDTLPGFNFILGVAELNYMQMTCNCTLWELYKTGETDPALDYKFEYIYEQS